MSRQWRLAGQFLLWRQENRRVNWSALLSAVGVAIGAAVLILSLSVLNGFQTEVEVSLKRFEGAGILHPVDPQADPAAARETLADAGISSSPWAERKLVLQTDAEYRLVSARIVTDLDSLMGRLGESLLTLRPYPGRGRRVLIGSLLANKLALFPGDVVRLISPLDVSLGNPRPPQLEVTVRSIFELGVLDFDDAYIFIDFETARGLIPGLETMSGLALQEEVGAGELAALLPQGHWELTTWRSEHAELISAMELEKIGSMVVLFLIVLVAAFSATSTMVMAVMEKYRQIGILRSLGASRKFVVGLFLRQGLIIGALGIGLGAGAGTGLTLLQMATGIVPGPGGVYLDGLPMLLLWRDVALVVLGTLAITMLSAWYPARYAAAIEPGVAVNYQK